MKNKKVLKLLTYCSALFIITTIASCKDEKTLLIDEDQKNAPIPRIVELQPANASVGDEITIVGVNFAEKPEDNEVKINQIIVPIISKEGSNIKVKVPEISGNVAGISVRSNGKISNKRNLVLVKIKTFEDDFNRSNTDLVGPTTVPNPFGSNWQIVAGLFGIKDNMLYTNAPSVESYVLYRDPELKLIAGEGSYFKITSDINVSAGSFGGIIFNAQVDNKRFYLLRINGSLVQFLKTGNNGLGDWANVMLSADFPNVLAGVSYKAEITSSIPGKILIKLYNKQTNDLVFDRSFDDPNPYLGGTPGFYYFGLANPVNITYDNFYVETM